MAGPPAESSPLLGRLALERMLAGPSSTARRNAFDPSSTANGRGRQAVRRVNGHLHLPALRTAPDRHVATKNVLPTGQNQTFNAA